MTQPFLEADLSLEALVADLLRTGQPARFRATGQSMTPLLQNGATVVVEPLGERLPRPGEIVLCQLPSDGRILLHRVVGWNGAGQLLTRGDHHAVLDPPHLPEGVLGRVVSVTQGDLVYVFNRPGWQILNGGLGWLAGWQVRLTGLAARQRLFVPLRKAATLSLNTAFWLVARLLGPPLTSLDPLPELEFVVICLQPGFGPRQIERLTRLTARADFDWQKVSSFAARHQVRSLVLSRLLTLDPAAFAAAGKGRVCCALAEPYFQDAVTNPRYAGLADRSPGATYPGAVLQRANSGSASLWRCSSASLRRS